MSPPQPDHLDPQRPPILDGRVVHLTAEYWPFARTGGLAEAVRGMAAVQKREGQATSVIMPLYRSVLGATTLRSPVIDAFEVTVGGRVERGRVWRCECEEDAPTVFFIEHAEYFDRSGLYGEHAQDYPDNLRRFAFFCAAAAELLPTLCPDARILHAHDWHTALAIPYVRYRYAGQPFYDRLGTILTVHNAAYQGHFPVETIPELGLPWQMYDWRYFEWYGRVNVLKGGLAFTDVATTVSPTHAAELRTPAGGFGLHDHFIAMGERFVGVLNGIDSQLWDPRRDPYVTAGFSADTPEPKRRNKDAVQRTYRLPRRARTPLFAMSARLVEQKGLDLILGDGLLTRYDAQFVFLGRGEPRYEAALAECARLAPDRIAVPLDFNERAEHRLLAGADALLMPSQFEPCGLTQMRAQRYGAVPVVRRVGGLADTVVDGVTGFLFDAYHADGLDTAVRRTIEAYHRRPAWTAMVARGMQQDFSWERSVAQYQDAYQHALQLRRDS
jgi:starch synthase